MPFHLMTLSFVDAPVGRAEALKILRRDHFCCRYCGLDGKASFENALVLSVDFVVPRMHKGKNFAEARKYVLAQREELHHAWQARGSPHAPRLAEDVPEPSELRAGI